MQTWKLEEAKNRFSEVVRLALSHEPQRVTRNGRDAVVVVSADDYERLTAPGDLVHFLQTSPLAEALSSGDLDLDRPRDLGRDVSF
ncbi:MAG: type II toxin-antitoxin system Phd/YefM family antitoxin [Longimicrobiaceae bacterium]